MIRFPPIPGRMCKPFHRKLNASSAFFFFKQSSDAMYHHACGNDALPPASQSGARGRRVSALWTQDRRFSLSCASQQVPISLHGSVKSEPMWNTTQNVKGLNFTLNGNFQRIENRIFLFVGAGRADGWMDVEQSSADDVNTDCEAVTPLGIF